MALENLVYNLPKSGGLSTLHALSRQKKAASNRFGRIASNVPTYHGVGDFAAAPLQNQMSGGGGEQPALTPVSAPTVPSLSSVTGTDPNEIGGFTIGKGTQGLQDMMSQEIGTNMAKGLFGRGFQNSAQTGATAVAMNAPISMSLQAALQSGILGAMSPKGLAKGTLDAIAASMSASDISDVMANSGIYGESMDVSSSEAPPMGAVAGNVAMSSLGNSPNTALSAALNALGISQGPSATDVTDATLDTAMQGLAQSPNISKGSQDPVAQAILSPQKHTTLENMMALNLSESPPTDTPTSINSIDMQGFNPMGLSNAPNAPSNNSGFSPMSLGMPSAPSDEGGINPMGFGSPDSSPDSEGISPMGLGPVGPAPGISSDGGDGGGDGTVICTELHRQGFMSDEIYKADSEYGKTLDNDTMRGYLSWGIPLAGAMRKSPILTAIVKPFALNWAYHMAGEHNLFGKIALAVGIPICRWLGTRQVLQREWSI